jgi:hypothetical protein
VNVGDSGNANSLPQAVSMAPRTRLGLSPVDSLAWLLHTLIVAVLIWNHEPWRDELQAWSIAMASGNPLDLLPNTRLEGRPPGWQLLLWPFAQISTSVRMMQLVTLVVGSIAAWWWLRRSVLDWRLKAVVLFGFLFTGGYLVHSRDYVLSFLMLVAATAVYEKRGASVQLALVLCALAWVNAFSLAMAAAFFAAVWVPEVVRWRGKSDQQRAALVEALVLCFGWFAWSAYLTYPTQDNQFQVGQYRGFGRALARSFVPLNYDYAWLERIDDFIGVTLLVLVLAWAWQHSRIAFAFVTMSFALLLYNLTYGYGDYWWHFGNAFMVVFVATCFPQRAQQLINEGDSHLGGVTRVVRTAGMAGLIVLATINVAATRYGAGRTVHSSRPYSMITPAAQQLREICDDCTIIVDWDAIGAGISAQLGGRELYYLNRSEFGTFAKFSNKNTAPTWEDGLAAMARFEKPVLIQTAFMSGAAPANLELIGVHLEGENDTNLIWQISSKRVVPND